jgi:uncharacterized radical SAM superfamily protein
VAADGAVTPWPEVVQRVEPLEDAGLDPVVIADIQARWQRPSGQPLPPICFYTPTFKTFQSSELSACAKASWPAISITGGDCELQCDHCKAKVLGPMIPARTPRELWDRVTEQVDRGAQGMLLTGGSSRRNEVHYAPFYSTLRRIKDSFPEFRITVHTALVNEDTALAMEHAGIDVAMMDVIGAQDTITQVYHLKRSVEDFEQTLAALVATRMKVVPHIVLGLHYGHLLGEWVALEMVQRHRPDALVLVVVMPFYAPRQRPFDTPDTHQVGHFFMDVRGALPDIPLLLGCARPPGTAKLRIDSYAVMAGLDGIAHPAEGVVELAARLGRTVRVRASCCSMVAAEGLMATDSDNGAVQIDLQSIMDQERRHRSRPRSGRLREIPVVARSRCAGP